MFLGLDIPDCIVDPESTSSPMDMIYEIYSKALANDDETFSRVLYYAARDSFKTIAASIIEVLSVLHLGRSVAHMAAIEIQSQKCAQYVKDWLGKPFIREYLVGNNKEIIWVVRYEHKETGQNINLDTFQKLSESDKNQYKEIKHYITIVVCTMAGANGAHTPLFVVDEVDVVRDPKAYEESKFIPAPYEGKMPITVLTSSRKFAIGLVQKEIDKAATSGLHIRHWNIIDVTAACPPSRHLPLADKIPIYVNDDEISAISEEAFAKLGSEEQQKYVKTEGYGGCLKNCQLFASCKGNLATRQLSKSSLLRPISHTTNQFKTASLPSAIAQLLCRKPSTEGMIYPNFSREVHMLTPAEMAERITGDPHDENLTKEQLIQIMKGLDLKWNSGMDFGYTHNFAVVTGANDGYRLFVVNVIEKPGLEPSDIVDECEKNLRDLAPNIFGDPENPQMVKVLHKHGFNMRKWKKTPGSVVGGIDTVRMKLRPTMGEPQIFILKGDEMCEVLATRLANYHWKLDAAGNLTNVPDEEEDDLCDAIRYLVMNVFGIKGKISVPKETDAKQAQPKGYTFENWMAKTIQEHVGDAVAQTPLKGKSGNFKFDM